MPGHINMKKNHSPIGKDNPQGPQLYAEIDKIFFSDGYVLAKEHLEKDLCIENMLNMSSALYDAVDGLIESFIQRCKREGKNIDCRKGCYLCCCQTVLVLPYEILPVVTYINKHLSKNDRDEIYERTVKKDNITRHMKVQEFLHYKDPCPLLKNGTCMVYHVRPMACRTYLSSSSAGCKTEYDNPKDIDIFPDLYEFTIRAGRMMNEGISAYLIGNQIFPTEWQIESSLLTALTDDHAFEQWLDGENIFQKRNYSNEEIKYLNTFGSGK